MGKNININTNCYFPYYAFLKYADIAIKLNNSIYFVSHTKMNAHVHSIKKQKDRLMLVML